MIRKAVQETVLSLALIGVMACHVYAGELHDAVMAKDAVKVRQFLDRGGAVDARGQYKRTPLHLAAMVGSSDIAALLIERGADVHARDHVLATPLHFAAEEGQVEIVRRLMEKGADVNALNEHKSTPLHRGAGPRGKAEIAALLIGKGAAVNARDTWLGDSPLHVAAEYGNAKVAAVLLMKGADINPRDFSGKTPLHRAVEGYEPAGVTALLVEKGADLNARDNKGETPAMEAEKRGKTELVAMLRRTGGGSTRQDFDAKLQTVAKAGFVSHEDLKVIVRLVRSLAQPPAIPMEVQEEMRMGKAAFRLARRAEDFKEPEGHFRKANLLAPWLPEPFYNLSVVQEKQGKWDEAKYSLEKYLIAAPEAGDAQAVKQRMAELDLQKRRGEDFEQEVNIGVILYGKGPEEYNEAIRHWKKAIELSPEHPKIDVVYYNIGEAYMNQGNLDDAYKYMQKSMEVNPDTDVAARYVNLGVVLEKRGDRAKACAQYKKACSLGSKVGCGNYNNACP